MNEFLVVWLIVIAIALVAEFLTDDMVAIWFAGGGIACAILSPFKLNLILQIIIFAVVSMVLLLSFRKMVLKFLIKETKKTNIDGYIGEKVKLLEDVSSDENGKVKIHGINWAVKIVDGKSMQAGETVEIIRVEGNKLIVK